MKALITASLSIIVAATLCSSCSAGRAASFLPDASADAEQSPPLTLGPFDAATCKDEERRDDLERDYDGDGFARKDDCDECNPSINKGAMDVPENGVDDDCDGKVDNEVVACDDNLTGSDAFDGARAIGLCKRAEVTGRKWGVIEARWVKPDGTPLVKVDGVGILGKFGVNPPPRGASMLGLSSGTLVESNQAVSVNKNYTSGTPKGYPKESSACPGILTGQAHDGAALLLKVRTPSNAKSLRYQQNFFTMEYPRFICKSFNDYFVVMLDPPPAGLVDSNIAFDSGKNPLSVNSSLLQVCSPGTHGGKTFTCPLGEGPLEQTGFAGHAATGWLTTSVPVSGGTEVTLLFAIWDSADGVYDSTVLVDQFEFAVEAVGETVTQPTVPK